MPDPLFRRVIVPEAAGYSGSGVSEFYHVTDAQFNPSAPTDRLTMAIALVKALGLDATAQSACNTNPGLADWQSIPQANRGYVSIAVSRGLMSVNSSSQFRPADAITHLELANAAMALLQASR